MKVSIKKLQKSQVELEIELSTEEFNRFVDKAIFNLGKDIEVKGFRKGKAPKEIIKERVGKTNIFTEATNLAIKENYKKAVLDNEIEPISQPEITILKLAPGNPFVFRAKVHVLPEIKLPDYKKIASQVERKKILVDEKEISDSLVFLQKSRAKFTALPRPAQEGDFVEIEYESPQIDFLTPRQGKEYENLKVGDNPKRDEKKIKDAFILGKGQLLPGFEEKLKGMARGEEKEFSLIWPENSFRKDLAGKKGDFKVKMKSVQKVELPEINDEFARNLGKFENLDSLKESIKGGLRIEKEIAETQRQRSEILEKIAQNLKLEIPEILIEFEKNRLLKILKENVNRNLKISFENYLVATKQTEENLKNSFLKEAQKRVKNFLILKEIGKREKISVGEEEAKQKLNNTLKNYSSTQIKKLDIEQLKEYIKGVIYNEKVFRKLESFSQKV